MKRQHYDLSADAGKIKLAQSVSRFCNAEDGGLVVVGMSTKKVPGGEEICSTTAARVLPATARKRVVAGVVPVRETSIR